MQDTTAYEITIGLEVHAQLQTNSKLFCSDSTLFDAAPNTEISIISLAHPGSLPKTNEKAIKLAAKAGLLLNCSLNPYSYFSRKNYFYPDLPKGYQITQDVHPICGAGYVTISINNEVKKIFINHIHLEEDAGKSIHDQMDNYSLIDLNRAGMPLIEIVTEPCLHSGEEVFLFLNKLRKTLVWAGVCDGNMEEGSLRCDVNISIAPKNSKILGTKVEIKNLNSIRNAKKAIEFEAIRMLKIVSEGDTIIQQTRGFDAQTDQTFAIRNKENAHDYRYFPDPDLPPIILSANDIQNIQAELPKLPEILAEKFEKNYQLSAYDAQQLTEEKPMTDYFLSVMQLAKNAKAVSNWMTGPVKQYLNENNLDYANIPLKPLQLAALIGLVDAGKINFSVAAQKILPLLINTDKTPESIAIALNLFQSNDTTEIEKWVEAVLAKMPDKVAEYKKGKKGLLGLFVGEVKKISQGKADPALATKVLQEKLSQ